MKIEPVTKSQVQMIAGVIGTIGAMICNLGDVDVSKGAGVLGPQEKCLWTKDGRRITITMTSDGGLIASCAKHPDPEMAAEVERRASE